MRSRSKARSTTVSASSRSCSAISPFATNCALSGVNSINWARILAQIVYYFIAAVALGAPDRPVSFAVPTGNFGDVLAGYYAKRMGLPVERLIVATNENDILARALASGAIAPQGVKPTQSPSMDIQVSSNFERLLFEASGRDAGRSARADERPGKQSGAFTIPPTPLARDPRRFRRLRASRGRMRARRWRRVYRESGVIDRSAHARSAFTPRARRWRRDRRRRSSRWRPRIPRNFPTRSSARPACGPPLPAHLARSHGAPGSDSTCCPTTPRAVARLPARRRAGRGVSVRVTSLPSGCASSPTPTPHLQTAAIGVFVGAGSRHERDERARPLASARAHGVQGHAPAQRARDRRGDRERRRRPQRRDRRRADRLFRPCAGRGRRARARHLADILTDSASTRRNSSARRTSSCRRSARSRTRPTIWCSISSPPPPGRTSRSAGRSSARARASRPSTAAAIDGYLGAIIAPARPSSSAAGAVEHDRHRRARAERASSGLCRRRRRADARAAYRGGETWSRSALEQTHIVVGFEGRRDRRAGPRRRPGVRRRGRRGHVVAAVPGSAREARPRLFDLRLSLGLFVDTGLFGFYAGSRRRGRRRTGGRRARLPRRGRARGSSEAEVRRAKAQMKVSLLAALELPGGARPAARAPDAGLRPPAVARGDASPASTRSTVADVRAAGARDAEHRPPTVAAIGAVGKVRRPRAKIARRVERAYDGAVPACPEPRAGAAAARRRALSAAGRGGRLSSPGRGCAPQAAAFSSPGSRPGRTMI